MPAGVAAATAVEATAAAGCSAAVETATGAGCGSAAESCSTASYGAATESAIATETFVAAETVSTPTRASAESRTSTPTRASPAGTTVEAASAVEAVEPRAGADEDAADEVVRAVVAVGCARVRSVRVVAVSADRSWTHWTDTNSEGDLRVRGAYRNHEQSK